MKVGDKLMRLEFILPSQYCFSPRAVNAFGKKLYVVCSTDWTEQQEDPKNAGLWERDWDDDSLNDDLSKSLREQLSKPAQAKS